MSGDFIDHLEQFLGPIHYGWKPVAAPSDIRAVMFKNRPCDGVDTFSSLGLSDEPLSMKGGRIVREELLLSVYPRYPVAQLASFLTTLADSLRSKGTALLRGDVVGPADSLIPGARPRAVYASLPVFLPESFATFRGTEPSTVIVWLIPLVGRETEFVKEAGWEAFEDILESRGNKVDLWDLDREPVV